MPLLGARANGTEVEGEEEAAVEVRLPDVPTGRRVAVGLEGDEGAGGVAEGPEEGRGGLGVAPAEAAEHGDGLGAAGAWGQWRAAGVAEPAE